MVRRNSKSKSPLVRISPSAYQWIEEQKKLARSQGRSKPTVASLFDELIDQAKGGRRAA